MRRNDFIQFHETNFKLFTVTCTESEGMSNPTIIPPGSISLFPQPLTGTAEDLRNKDDKSVIQFPRPGVNINIQFTANKEPIQVTKLLIITGDSNSMPYR